MLLFNGITHLIIHNLLGVFMKVKIVWIYEAEINTTLILLRLLLYISQNIKKRENLCLIQVIFTQA